MAKLTDSELGSLIKSGWSSTAVGVARAIDASGTVISDNTLAQSLKNGKIYTTYQLASLAGIDVSAIGINSGWVGSFTKIASLTILSSSPPIFPASINDVFEGDSITNGVNATSSDKSYPSISVSLSPSGPVYTLNNIATPGLKSSEMNNNYTTRGQAAYDPSKALNTFSLMAGTNDGTSALVSYRNLRALLRKAKATGYQRRLIGTLPSRNDAADTKFDGNTLPLNLWIRQYYNSDLDCDAIFDFAANPLFDTADKALNTTYYSDYLHMTDAGYAVLGQIHEAAIAPVFLAAGSRVDPPATWSIFDTSVNLVFSNDNRTLAWPSDNFGAAASRGFIGKTSGKWSWETVIDAQADVDFNQVGVCNQAFESEAQQSISMMGNSPNAIGWANEAIRYNNTDVVPGMGKLLTGDVVQHAIDVDNKKYWVRKNGGVWNASASSDPSTGVGGIDISALGSGILYPAVGLYKFGGQITARFTSAQMSSQVSGYPAIGG